MSNPVRQQAILRLVRDRAISTQLELVDALRDEGHDVVQTTISRDVHDLGLRKVRAPSGRLVYAAPGSDDADRLRATDAPGFWERYGYHNDADPWKEQRYAF